MQMMDKTASIICAVCEDAEIRNGYLYCPIRKKTAYNAKPNWCPHPTWIEKEEYYQLSLFDEWS